MQISCLRQSYWEVPERFKGFLDRPRPSGGVGVGRATTVQLFIQYREPSEEGTS